MQEQNPKIKVGISIGDLNGIGSEIILKTFADKRMLEICTPVIFASYKSLNYLKKQFNLNSLNIEGVKSTELVVDGQINVVDIWQDHVIIKLGNSDPSLGKYALDSFVATTNALKNNEVDVMVTAPIDKHNIQQGTAFKFPGHTDYLNQELEGDSLMLMIHENLRLGLLTDHVPLKEVTQQITPKLINQKIRTINQTLLQDFGIRKPKIAVLGINPHCGDQGVIGNVDDQLLAPTLEKLQSKGVMAYGPYAADGFFGSANYRNFDAVIAPYHDQGLVAFKTLSFGQGVNYTAGLSHIRTSPDHGTAFDIAGKNKADHHSFRQAVYKAIDLYRERKLYFEISANSL